MNYHSGCLKGGRLRPGEKCSNTKKDSLEVFRTRKDIVKTAYIFVSFFALILHEATAPCDLPYDNYVFVVFKGSNVQIISYYDDNQYYASFNLQNSSSSWKPGQALPYVQ